MNPDVDLPSGWVKTTLADIATWGSGGTPSRSNKSFYGGDIPWFKTGELGPRLLLNSEETITEAALQKSSAKLFPAGSVALAMYGATIGKVSIFGLPAATNQACAVGQPKLTATSSAFLYQYLRSQKDAFVAAGQGGAQPNISQTVVKAWPVPLPPLAEQRRIADKLDTVLARVDAVNDRLARVAPLLKRFRQSVLAAGISGKLTQEWRDQLGLGQHADSQIEGRQLKSLVDLDVGFAFKSSTFADTGVRLLRGDNIEPGRLRWRDAKHLPESELDPLRHLHLREGDVVLAMDRPVISTGLKIARVQASDLPCLLVQRVCRFRTKGGISSDYLFIALRSSSFVEHLMAVQNGSSIPHISGAQILSFSVTVPDLSEQAEIVRRVELLLDYADRLEARLQAAQTATERLTPALLAKAFRGELVPQDPYDEPAGELLKRLAAQPAQSGATTRLPRGRKAATRAT